MVKVEDQTTIQNIMVTADYQPDTSTILLSPNRSASWQNSKWLVILFGALVMMIAIGWSLIGAWIVLPFAGLEVALFACLMYKVSYRTYEQQLIVISPSNILIESGFRRKRSITLSRMSAYVEFRETEQDWELPVTTLISSNEEVEVGQFLNLADRRKLRLDLQKAGLVVCRSHWWKQ